MILKNEKGLKYTHMQAQRVIGFKNQRSHPTPPFSFKPAFRLIKTILIQTGFWTC